MSGANSVGFLGSGAMASSIGKGLAKGSLFAKIVLFDIHPEVVDRVCATAPSKLIPARSPDDLLACDIVVVAVKPQYAEAATRSLRGKLKPSQVVVSIMAGVTLAKLREYVGAGPKLVRTMPNTPLLVGLGATGVAPDSDVPAEQRSLVLRMFESLGVAVEVHEGLLDAVTGVSGSGPAYVAIFIEALADAGVKEGLPRAVAAKLAAATVYGAGGMVATGAVSSAVELKEMVCSPGGTTIAAVGALEANRFRHAVFSAVTAARKRATEMSKL